MNGGPRYHVVDHHMAPAHHGEILPSRGLAERKTHVKLET